MFRYESHGPVGHILIDRPERRNAIPAEGWGQLAATVAEARQAAPRSLVLRTAVSGIFCAGADIDHIATLAEDVAGRAAFRLAMREAIDGLAALPFPVVAAVDGGCFGAGVALVLACDIAIAGDHAAFAVPPAKLGISYPQEDVNRLVARIGRGQAARLLLGMDIVNGEEAARIGLVELAVMAAHGAAEQLAQKIAGGSPGSFAALKTTIDRAGQPGDAESDAMFDAGFASADFAEGVAAFRERRTARFGE